MIPYDRIKRGDVKYGTKKNALGPKCPECGSQNTDEDDDNPSSIHCRQCGNDFPAKSVQNADCFNKKYITEKGA